MIAVPDDFATAAVIRDGEAGRKWINQLPDLVDGLCQQWRLIVDGEVMHGYLGLVVPVRRGTEPCALKVSWRDESTADEATALITWGGQGAVRLLEVEPARGAMLLERLDSTRSLDEVEIEAAITIAGRLLRRLAIPAPSGFRSLSAWAEDFCLTLPQRWQATDRPFPRRLLDQVWDIACAFGPQSGDLLVNYDLHYADVLAGQREPWLAVDPKVVVGDPEFGMAQLLWCRLEDILAHEGLDRQFRRLIEAADLDLPRAHGWTLVRCVDYWLWGLSVGLTEDPARCKAITEWLA